MIQRALVTGATGMLGSYIVERLQAEGAQVRGLVRQPDQAGWLAQRGVELCAGELGDREAVRRAAAGCDTVFHAAAAIGSGTDWGAFYWANVVGTANMLAAAEGAGARLVCVSSTAVFGRARYRATPTDETVRLPELPGYDHYGRSKQLAELHVLEAHEAGRQWTCVVRPPVMYGRRDRQFAPRLAPVVETGVFPLIGGGRSILTLAHARSVADGAVRAASTDTAGGRIYHLTNDAPVSVSLLVRSAGVGLDRSVHAPRLPIPVGKGGFAALGLAFRMAGRGDLARHVRGTFDMLTRDNPFTSDRARSELSWEPDIDPAFELVEAFRWWKEHKASRNGRTR